MIELSVAKSPSEDLSVTNRVYFNQADWNAAVDKFVSISCTSKGTFKFRTANDKRVERGTICLGGTPRKWLFVSIGEKVRCAPATFDSNLVVSEVVVELDLNNKKLSMKDAVDSDKLAMQFLERFLETPVAVDQQMLFNAESINFLAVVKTVKTVDVKNASVCPSIVCGVLQSNTVLKFDRRAEAKFTLSGRCKGDSGNVSIISPDWDFNSIGVGGLDDEFARIFRRAFMSRLMPPDLVEELGIKHVRGILLHGPPGTGKTLMARQIGKMLNAREPKIVNGPSILDKYVGESEANIRKLFADAEKEYEKMGNGSALHIIIFDEIDAICKARGSLASSTAVHDTVVNQLLSKMDGVEQLNNILVIGMTNRKDLIDEALLRPGRMEVTVEIPLANEHGRRQIFEIHCKRLRESGVLGADVDLAELAGLTKNFSGAEIEGLVRAALSNAQTERFDPKKGMAIRREEFDSFHVSRSHFLYSLQNDIKPFFGQQDNEVQAYLERPIVIWGAPLEELLSRAHLLTSSLAGEGGAGAKVTLLLHGPSHSGKTSLAAHLARDTGFTFVRMCSIRTMIGFSEAARCLAIKKVFDDAAKAPSSVVILDDLEHLIDYVGVGPRFSVTLVKNLIGMVTTPAPPGKRMLVLGTTEHLLAMRELGLLSAFGKRAARVPVLRHSEEVATFLEEQSLLSERELGQLRRGLDLDADSLRIGVKQLLAECAVLRTVEPEARVPHLLASLKAAADDDDE